MKKDLKSRGLKVWLDAHEIRPGNRIPEAVSKGIDASRSVVLVVSRHSEHSRWIAEETNLAIYDENDREARFETRLIPIKKDNAELPRMVRSRRFVDFTDEESYETSLKLLMWGITGEKPEGFGDVQSPYTVDEGSPLARLMVPLVLMALLLGAFFLHRPRLRDEPVELFGEIALWLLTCGLVGLIGWAGEHYKVLSPELRRGISDMLLSPKWPEAVSKWPKAIGDWFDELFGKETFSWKRVWRSSLGSVSAVAFFILVFFMLDLENRWIHGPAIESLGGLVVGIILCGAVLNLIPDYLSLAETRWILKRMGNASGLVSIVGLLVLDAAFTLGIFALVLVVVNPMVAYVLSQFIAGYGGASRELGSLSAAGSSLFDAGLYGPVEGILSFFRTNFELRDIFSVFLYSTFFTSIWIWVCLGIGLITKLTLWFRCVLNLADQTYPGTLRERPLMFAACLVIVLISVGVGYGPLFRTPGAATSSSVSNQARIKSLTIQTNVFCGIPMARISEETFMMGTEDGDPDEKLRWVKISEDFWMGVTEVTQKQWRDVTAGTELDSEPSFFSGSDLRPVESVSWHDATNFVSRLNERLREWPEPDDAPENWKNLRFRLPTEAEWEWACRADSTGPFPFRARKLNDYAWTIYNSGGRTHPVAEKNSNRWGLHDMHGNVWEWVRDWYAPYSEGITVDPVGPKEGSGRVIRGGGWGSDAWWCRSAVRSRNDPDIRNGLVGFRVVLAPPPGSVR